MLMNAELQSIVAVGIAAISAMLLLRGAMRKKSNSCKGGCGCHTLKKSFLKKVRSSNLEGDLQVLRRLDPSSVGKEGS